MHHGPADAHVVGCRRAHLHACDLGPDTKVANSSIHSLMNCSAAAANKVAGRFLYDLVLGGRTPSLARHSMRYIGPSHTHETKGIHANPMMPWPIGLNA